MAYRVGLVGAGPVAQAIHLPTLARFGDAVRVTEVMDVDPAMAKRVAGPYGARPSQTMDELLAGDGIDIAVVGSPNRFHAEQVEQLCAAGVRGILVEKPFATTADEADRVVTAAQAHSVALVVGAMHTYDPAWLAVVDAVDLGDGPFHVRSSIYIPDNARFEDFATTMIRPAQSLRTPVTDAEKLRGGVLGLAVHDLPMIRRILPQLDHVSFAAPLEPGGYTITASGPAGTLELLARTGGTWRTDWTLSVYGGSSELQLSFPPSYVHAGSATATIHSGPVATTHGPYSHNGYEGEWRELLAMVGGALPTYNLAQLTDDLRFAMSLGELTVEAFTNRMAAA